MKNSYISSPLNYVGNKYKLLEDILPVFPDDTTTIVEIFAGSAMVSINSDCKKLILNDLSVHAISLLKYFYDNSYETVINNTEKIIEKYNFTDTYKYGYSKYPTEKNLGLSRYNKEPYNALKKDYNNNPSVDKLFVLILFGFNHFLRFNQKGEYNVPVGKVDFSKKAREKTFNFMKKIKEKNIVFHTKDFRDKSLYIHNTKAVFYFDPPYLITTAPYNSVWGEKEEKDLLNILDELNFNNIKFMLSNVIESNGKENSILKEWSKKYNVKYLNKEYKTASYNRKNDGETIEVLITNFNI